jgi:hypothetical protein
MNKRAVAAICVVAAFMKKTSRLPGQKALKRSIALATRLATSCESFINMNSFVEGNELSASVRVARVLDVTTIFTLELATRAPRIDNVGRVTHSLCSHTEARAEVQALPVGAVGMRVGLSRADAFIKKEMAFDRITQTRTGEWAVCTDCDARGILEDDNVEDAELIIFEAVAS